jgi:hypothetical protein
VDRRPGNRGQVPVIYDIPMRFDELAVGLAVIEPADAFGKLKL